MIKTPFREHRDQFTYVRTARICQHNIDMRIVQTVTGRFEIFLRQASVYSHNGRNCARAKAPGLLINFLLKKHNRPFFAVLTASHNLFFVMEKLGISYNRKVLCRGHEKCFVVLNKEQLFYD